MNPTRLANVTVFLDGTPDEVRLDGAGSRYPVLQIGTALTVHLDNASTETLLAVAAKLTQAAESRALKAVA